MTGAGIDPKTKPTTGQDAELAAIQRILAGQQYMTVYKAIKPEAGDAAMLAVALAKGQSAPASLTLTKINNGTNQVNALILTPVAVTAANIKSTVVADGFWTAKRHLHRRLRGSLHGGRHPVRARPGTSVCRP
jgi:D-xylose transport system substrate-binding protein